MKRILLGIIVMTMIASAFPAKQATAACPTDNMLSGFIKTGSISNGMKAYPSCRVIFKGMAIDKILERNWSSAKVLWTDINGNSRVDFVLIEAVR